MLDCLLLLLPLRYTPQLTCCDGDQYAPRPSAQALTCGVELACDSWLLLQPLRYTPQLTCCDGDQHNAFAGLQPRH
jgi:hypothetical protein